MSIIGIVGLGLLGHAIASRLIKAGHTVIGFDVLPDRVSALTAMGGTPASSAAAVAQSAEAVDEVCAEHLVAVADECIVAVPLVDAEVDVEAVCDGVPGHLPAHSRLQARDVRLRRA